MPDKVIAKATKSEHSIEGGYTRRILRKYRSDIKWRTLLAWLYEAGRIKFHAILFHGVKETLYFSAVHFDGGIMTSEERKAIRLRRRKEKRSKRKTERAAIYDNFEKVFTFEHLWKAYLICLKGVSWKKSVAVFIANASLCLQKLKKALLSGKYKSTGFNCFWIKERGKLRFIQAVTFEERIVQRCLCDYCLVPLLTPSFIEDNWASQKGKGYHYAIRRIRKKLARHIRVFGKNGYLLIYDFHNFFGSLSHSLAKSIVKEAISDRRIIHLIFHFIDCFGKIGLGLGSQISQILALAIGNKIDHCITELYPEITHGRYMDDGILISESKKVLQNCLTGLRKISEKLGLRLNEKKTGIVKLSHGFTFLKKRFTITDSHKIVMKIARKSIAKERIKLKKLILHAREFGMTVLDICQSFMSWRGYAEFGNSFHTVQNMEAFLYKMLYESIRRIPFAPT